MIRDDDATSIDSPVSQNVVSIGTQRKKKNPKGTYTDYIQLAHDTLGELKRDLFSLDLMCFNKIKRRWVPVLQTQNLGILKSRAYDSGGFLSAACIESHILTYENTIEPELLVKVPEWDGIDRVAQIADCIRCKSYSSVYVEELIKDWLAKLFLRLDDPVTYQNRILLFQGAEGLGKDTLLRAMLGGLGQFFTGFTIQSQEKDTFDLVCGAAVLNVSEFDRLYRKDMGLMKSIITEPEHKYRGSYERRSEFKIARSSFVGSCNNDDILKESGINRRYIILDVERIDWNYPVDESPQVLAQGRRLAQERFSASASAEGALKEYIGLKSPLDADEIILEDYTRLFFEKYGRVKMQSSKMDDLWDALTKRYSKISAINLKSMVKTSGYGRREGPGIFYWPELGYPKYDMHTPNAEYVTQEGNYVDEDLPF